MVYASLELLDLYWGFFMSISPFSKVSDTVGMRVQTFPLTHHHCHHEEDMFERSRVTRRLSKVETELEMTSQQLGDLQRSREVLVPFRC